MRIAVFTKNRTNPAYGAARLGADRAGARFGARVTHHVPGIPDDLGEQRELFEQVLLQRPDAIAVSPVHPTGLDAAMREAAAAGIPLVGFVSRVARAPWVSFVGSDDYRLALALAERVFRELAGAGDVVIIEGSQDSQTSIDRVAGFRDAASQAAGIRIAASCNGRYQRESAREAMGALLRMTSRIDAVLAANDVMALGAIVALRPAGRTALVAGVNAIPEAIEAIKIGAMLATADYSAMNLGALAVECAARHLRGETVPREVLLPVQIVDRGNVAAWDMPYESRRCLSWVEACAAMETIQPGR